MGNLDNIKNDFPLLQNRDIAYLDSGATSQKPQEVIDVIENFYKNFKWTICISISLES